MTVTFTRIAIAGECGHLVLIFSSLTRVNRAVSSASFILRVYAVVPKTIVAYVQVGVLSMTGLLSVIFDIVRNFLSTGATTAMTPSRGRYKQLIYLARMHPTEREDSSA